MSNWFYLQSQKGASFIRDFVYHWNDIPSGQHKDVERVFASSPPRV